MTTVLVLVAGLVVTLVLLWGIGGPSEAGRFAAIQAINEAGMRDGWLALSETGDSNAPWQHGSLGWDGDGLDQRLIVALSDELTAFAPGSDRTAYFERLNHVTCEVIWPLVTQHLGTAQQVEIYAWDEELTVQDRLGGRSGLIAHLPDACTRD
jgi:hypothetical protein